MDLRDAIHRIALEWPCYGRPRITAELRDQGWKVNPKRVYRLMREDNLLCLRKRQFVVTTDSNHGRRIYPNLAAEVALAGVNQLWVADITYVRLEEEFILVAVVLDAYSRRVIGWALDRNMEDELTLTALRMALAERDAPPGLIHHSDRGSQYASNDYAGLLRDNGIAISMSRKGNPWDNAFCESFMAQNIEIPVVHRTHDPLRLLFLIHAKPGVDRANSIVELAQHVIRRIERSVAENIHLGRFQNADGRKARIQLVDEADLFPQVFDRHAARDLQTLRVVSDADVFIPTVLRCGGHLLD